MEQADVKKVLVVDDELNIRTLVKSMLVNGYTVLEAENGKEAVRIARSQRPDLILMDILMPEMDGYTACSVIKTDQQTEVIPVVFLTAVGYQLNKELAKQVGAEGYITKPFTAHGLLDTIGKFLQYPE